MKFAKIIIIGVIMLILAGCTMPLKMAPPAPLNFSTIKKHPYTMGLFIPQKLKEYVYVKTTSPIDKISYPIGEQTAQFFRKNLPSVFEEVIDVTSKNPSHQDVDVILEPSIVKFDSVIPFPAYNPYTATIIYRVEVYDREGEKIFTQTATGNAQTSKGLMSGFSARKICAQVAQKAMGDALRQIIEGLAEAEELKDYK